VVSPIAVVIGLVVVSGLAPRRAAKQPPHRRWGVSDRPKCLDLGQLHHPARGKPAHYNNVERFRRRNDL